MGCPPTAQSHGEVLVVKDDYEYAGFSVSGKLRCLLLGARVGQKWYQKIEGESEVCLSSCSSITEVHS